MNLTTDEYNILATRHANSYEASQLRDQLMAEGLHFCSICKTIKEADAFRPSAKGRGGRESSCRRCHSKKRRGRRSGYIPTGPRYAENEARRRERDPEAWREGKRKAGRKHHLKNREARNEARKNYPRSPYDPVRSRERYLENRTAILDRAAQRRQDDPEKTRASKRRNFQKRKALGMSGRQANYMAPAPEFRDSWNTIKR